MASSSSVMSHDDEDLDKTTRTCLEDSIKDKAKELFQICDKSAKGYINQDDMQSLREELPLDENQLAKVFEELDQDSSGFLTFDEFYDGFIKLTDCSEHNARSDATSDDESEQTKGHQQAGLIGSLQNMDYVHDPENIKSYMFDPKKTESYCKENSNSTILENSDNEIKDVIKELEEVKREKSEAERVLHERSKLHAKQMQDLSEEMEEQMMQERRRVLEDKAKKEKNISLEFKEILKKKEDHLKEVTLRQKDLEQNLARVNLSKQQAINENSELMQMNESLARELQNARKELNDTLMIMGEMRSEEGIEMENEENPDDFEKKNLLTQLEILREHNRKLKDDKDEVIQLVKNSGVLIQSQTSNPTMLPSKTSTPINSRPSVIQGSEVGKYFPEEKMPCEGLDNISMLPVLEDEQQYSDSTLKKAEISKNPKLEFDKEKTFDADQNCFNPDEDESKIISPELNDRQFRKFYRKLSQVPDGCSSSEESSREETSATEFRGSASSIDRIYKVVFVGDSGVGKTSTIRKFVSGKFSNNYSSTIGVDYQIRTMNVGDQKVALQLWDTAGQERYRSITRQYFRKADGVVIVYDVTNEQSFLAVRNWIQCIQEGVDPSAVLLLLGNKVDKSGREVKHSDGERLAAEHNSSYFEISAKSGHNLHMSMMSLSVSLAQSDDEKRESVLSLKHERTATTSCCLSN